MKENNCEHLQLTFSRFRLKLTGIHFCKEVYGKSLNRDPWVFLEKSRFLWNLWIHFQLEEFEKNQSKVYKEISEKNQKSINRQLFGKYVNFLRNFFKVKKKNKLWRFSRIYLRNDDEISKVYADVFSVLNIEKRKRLM